MKLRLNINNIDLTTHIRVLLRIDFCIYHIKDYINYSYFINNYYQLYT
jgi:hypothetical protein